jgi:TonB family protein
MKKQILQWGKLSVSLFVLAPGLALAAPQAAARNDAVRKASASMVLLSGSDEKGNVISGTGLIVCDGVVVTSYDFAKDAIAINATFTGGETRSAGLFGVDERRDVALLRVAGVGVSEALSYSRRRQLVTGDRVYIVDNPEPAGPHSRRANVGNPVTVRGRQYMSVDDMRSGANGNPVLDESGSLIGLLGIAVENGNPVAFVVPTSSLLSLLIKAGVPPALAGGVPGDAIGDEPGGVPGGVIGGVPGGIPGGIPSGVPGNTAEPGNSAGGQPETGSNLPKIIRKSGGVLQGAATRRAVPWYPPLAKAARISGSVVVEVVIDEDGYVVRSAAISGHPLLKDTAAAAAMGWKFMPTKLEGQPVKVIGTITFNFQM